MDGREIERKHHQTFEDLKETNESGLEFWTARKLAKILEYSEYRHFLPVIEKAKEACRNSGHAVRDHFEDILGMVGIGSGAMRELPDVRLSRYACYLIAQNADSSKSSIALAQTYFAIQTRRQEVFESLSAAEKRLFIRGEVTNENKKLFSTARQAGVRRFGAFNDEGYKGLYGRTLADIEKKKGIKKGELLDRAGSTELAANLFRITQTDEKIKKEIKEEGLFR